MWLAIVVVDVDDYRALALDRQPLADSPDGLQREREDEVVKQPLVVAHATGGMVVNADSEQIAVEAEVVGQRQMAFGLKSKTDLVGSRPVEGMHPLDGCAKHGLDTTTSLAEGEPEDGKEVSVLSHLLVVFLNKLTDSNNMCLVLSAQRLIPGATPTRAWREATRPPPEARRPGGDEELGKGAAVNWR